MIFVAPSILSADFSHLADEIHQVELAGADWIHVDIMDGHFVPNLTIGPAVVKSIRKHTRLPFDVHLMIDEPEKFIESFIEAGADRITVHVENCNHLNRVLRLIKQHGIKTGVALNPATPITSIEHVLNHELDLVLLMTVNPGFGGQQFISSVLPKIKKIRERLLHDQLHQVRVQVDGGINDQTAQQVIEAGADVLVSGNYIFNHSNRSQAILQLRGN